VKHSLDDTIAAIATPLGQAGLGVIRISGKRALPILRKITSFKGKIPSHKLRLAWIKQDGVKFDQAMTAYMKAPQSYTGEDVVEISCHGSPVVLKKALSAIIASGARLAEPGEFTKRAFLGGKIDLTQAEAVIDLIQSGAEAAIINANKQMAGTVGDEVRGVRRALLGALGETEAAIDFPDDIMFKKKEIKRQIEKQIKRIGAALAGAEEGRMIREGARVVIAGRPNVGKSSLLNALIMSERAIVSKEPGTTRDTIEEMISLGGMPVVLIDTAGLRGGRGEAELAGVRRAENELKNADLALVVFDLTRGLGSREKALIAGLKKRRFLLVGNKADLPRKEQVNSIYPHHTTSAKNGKGVGRLKEAIKRKLLTRSLVRQGPISLINERHRECLTKARESLIRGLAALNREDCGELVAEDLKKAIIALGEIGGEDVSAEVIGGIFSRFCVGK